MACMPVVCGSIMINASMSLIRMQKEVNSHINKYILQEKGLVSIKERKNQIKSMFKHIGPRSDF